MKLNSTKTIRNFRNKIYELDINRALFIMNTLWELCENWMCNFQYAKKLWITWDEWTKSQHFFLANSSQYRDIVMEELKRRKEIARDIL